DARYSPSRNIYRMDRFECSALSTREILKPTLDGEAGSRVDLDSAAAPNLHPRGFTGHAHLEDRAGRGRALDFERHELPCKRDERRGTCVQAVAGGAHPALLPRRIAARASRSASRVLIAWRLSCFFLPRATATSSFARLFLK